MARRLLTTAYGIGEMARLPWRRAAVVNAAMNPRDDGLGVVRYRAIAEALHDIVINQSERETP
jgi:hypothetical protein